MEEERCRVLQQSCSHPGSSQRGFNAGPLHYLLLGNQLYCNSIAKMTIIVFHHTRLWVDQLVHFSWFYLISAMWLQCDGSWHRALRQPHSHTGQVLGWAQLEDWPHSCLSTELAWVLPHSSWVTRASERAESLAFTFHSGT